MPPLDDVSRARLLANGRAQSVVRGTPGEIDFRPVVKLFTPGGPATWLLTEVDPGDTDLAFGLCDLGLGEPELGYVRISELRSLRGLMGLRVERDLHFRAQMTLSAYAHQARMAGRIFA